METQIEGARQPLFPDTLDLRARARAVLNYLVENPDPGARYQPHFVANLEADPPYLEHNEWDFGDVSGRFVEAMALVRLMTGDHSGADAESGLKDFILSLLDPEEGLLYRPQSAYNSYPLASTGGRAGAYIWDQRILNALLAWHITSGDPLPLQRMERLVAGLARIAVRRGEAKCFPTECYLGAGRWMSEIPMMWVPDGQLIDPLVRYHELTGDRSALDLARGLGRSVLEREPPTFGPEGEILRDSHNTHFHSRASALVGLLRLAVATSDEGLAGFVERCYRWARARGSSFGWMPEQLRTVKWSETCCITDMIDIALLLAESGHAEYWEDVERFVRNCLAESQVLSPTMLPRPWRKVAEKVPGSRSYERVPERVIGGFVGSVFPNDRHFQADWSDGFGISGCCSPHGAKGLYLAWSHVASKEGNGIRVNLSMSAATPWAEIISSHPYRGEVEVWIKDAESARIRVPSWAARETTRISKNGKELPLLWDGDHVVVKDTRKGDRVAVSYPMARQEKVEHVAGVDYVVLWRGDTVVSLEPAGARMPLYQRKAMDTDRVALKSGGPSGKTGGPSGTGLDSEAANLYHII